MISFSHQKNTKKHKKKKNTQKKPYVYILLYTPFRHYPFSNLQQKQVFLVILENLRQPWNTRCKHHPLLSEQYNFVKFRFTLYAPEDAIELSYYFSYGFLLGETTEEF